MKRSRRVSRMVTTLCTANTVFFAAETLPVASAETPRPKKRTLVRMVPVEKVVARAKGTRASITVAGKPGRHVALFWAPKGTDDFRQVRGSEGTIGDKGIGNVQADVRSLGGRDVLLAIVTADDAGFSKRVLATEPVRVRVLPAPAGSSLKGVLKAAHAAKSPVAGSIGGSAGQPGAIKGASPAGTPIKTAAPSDAIKGSGQLGGTLKGATSPLRLGKIVGGSFVRSATPPAGIVPAVDVFPGRTGVSVPK